MRKTIFSILLVSIWSLLTIEYASADDCGGLIEGKWNVKQAGDIKKHLKNRLKIEKTGNGTYSVKIKNDDGETAFKSGKDFTLTCSENSSSAVLAGHIKMGDCTHSLEVGGPYNPSSSGKNGSDNIYIKFTADHDKVECRGHKDSLHDKDPRKHIQVAYGKRAGS